MQRQRGLGYAAILVGGATLVGPYLSPPWLVGLAVILYALILWHFFNTKYLTYTFCALAILYGSGLLPFFVFAIGLILYGASTYILAVNSVPDLPVTPAVAGMVIMYSTLFGLACAIVGVIIQYIIGKKLAEQQKEAIIETI